MLQGSSTCSYLREKTLLSKQTRDLDGGRLRSINNIKVNLITGRSMINVLMGLSLDYENQAFIYI